MTCDQMIRAQRLPGGGGGWCQKKEAAITDECDWGQRGSVDGAKEVAPGGCDRVAAVFNFKPVP